VKIWTKYKDNTIFRFVLSFAIGTGLNLLVTYSPIISSAIKNFITSLNLSTLMTYLTTKHLNLLGVSAFMTGNMITIGENSIYFTYACLGISNIVRFAGFILTYFGQFYKKLLYILVGIFVLLVANVSRVTFISIVISYDFGLFDFVHKYGTIFFVYGTIFLLWVVWSKINNR
jgi:exosortase/archaeosortase family protein